MQRSKKRLLSEPQNKANKPNRTRDIICVGFFLWLGKTTTSPEKSHASCRLKVKQPSPDLAKVKSYYTFSAQPVSSNSIRADGSTAGAGSRSSASAGSGSRSRASSESRSRETSEHAAAPPYPSPASLSRSI